MRGHLPAPDHGRVLKPPRGRPGRRSDRGCGVVAQVRGQLGDQRGILGGPADPGRGFGEIADEPLAAAEVATCRTSIIRSL